MSRNPSAMLEPELRGSYRVLSPVGTGPLLRLDRTALGDLELLIRQGIQASSGRGVEVGGVILGFPLDWTAAELIITGFIPVDLKHRFGPAFRPAVSDAALFKGMVPSPGSEAIGYFRSHLSGEPSLRAEDVNLLAQLFPGADSCFFAVHASANTPSNVDLYRIEKGAPPELLELFALKESEPFVPAAPVAAPAISEAISEASSEEIPESRKSTGPEPATTGPILIADERPANLGKAPAEPRAEETLQPQAAPGPEATPSPEEAPSPEASPQPSRNTVATIARVPVDVTAPFRKVLAPETLAAVRYPPWAWIGAGGFLIALAIFTFVLDRRAGQAPVAVPSASAKPIASLTANAKFHLTTVEQGPQIMIRWNAAHPAIASSVRGVLVISERLDPGEADSTTSDEIDLNIEGMNAGQYLYQPVNKLLSVQLMIYQPDGSFTGETKLFAPVPSQSQAPNLSTLSPATPSPAAPPSTAPFNNKQAPAQAQIRSQPFRPTPIAPDLTAPTAKSEPATVGPAAGPAKTARVWAPQPAGGPPKTELVPTLLDPPDTTGALAASGPKLAMPPLPAPPVAAAPIAAPATPNLNYRAARGVPAAPARLLAPRMVRQALPTIPMGVAAKIRTEVQLDVNVTIDADGKVTGARIVSSQGSAAGLLAIEALKAAQLSRFLPAQQDGQPVPGSLVVTFRFAPKP